MTFNRFIAKAFMKATAWIRAASALTLLGIGTAQAFDLQGHRGARGLAPENTLAAFERALEVGVHTLELDIVITRDGAAVIGHDPKLNPNIVRNASGQWLSAPGPAISSLTLAEVRAFDVGRLKPGTRYAQTYPEQVAADGERMPALADLFARVRALGADTVRFNIEAKLTPLEPDVTPSPEVFVKAIVDAVNAHGMASRVSLQSFDWRTLAVAQRIAPRVPRVALSAQQDWLNNIADPRWTAGLTLTEHGSVPRMAKAAGANIWSPFFGDLSAELLIEARALGMKVVVWTVNQPADIDRMLAMGVDGIISDYPDRVRTAMAARGMALPTPLPRVASPR